MKFRHEIYPDNAKEASRQILLVSEVEVRDRLASSQINKFLYQYSSESRPKQSHANMVRFKSSITKQLVIFIICIILREFTSQRNFMDLHCKSSKLSVNKTSGNKPAYADNSLNFYACFRSLVPNRNAVRAIVFFQVVKIVPQVTEA